MKSTIGRKKEEEAGNVYARRQHKNINLISSACAALVGLALLSGIFAAAEANRGNKEMVTPTASTQDILGCGRDKPDANRVDLSEKRIFVNSGTNKGKWKIELVSVGFETELENGSAQNARFPLRRISGCR